jgi:hypothetical protein
VLHFFDTQGVTKASFEDRKMKLDNPGFTAAYAALALVGPIIVQWFVLPESGPFPPMDNDDTVMIFERLCHYGNILTFAILAGYYATMDKKHFEQDNYGWLLVGLLMQHVIEQYQHETGPSTTDSILHENRVWTTYAVVIFNIYCLRHGYANTFNRFAAEPFFVFLAIINGLLGTHASCITNWTFGTYIALEGGLSYNVRVIKFIGLLGLLGFIVKKYFDVHGEQAKKLKAA